jgi:hypothetical protein
VTNWQHSLSDVFDPMRRRPNKQRHRRDADYLLDHRRATIVGPGPLYTLFADIDPTHGGIAKIQRPGQPIRLSVVDPSKASSSRASTEPASTANASASVACNRTHFRWRFSAKAFVIIVTGYDHILFPLCLLLPAVMRPTAEGWQRGDNLSEAILPVLEGASSITSNWW